MEQIYREDELSRGTQAQTPPTARSETQTQARTVMLLSENSQNAANPLLASTTEPSAPPAAVQSRDSAGSLQDTQV